MLPLQVRKHGKGFEIKLNSIPKGGIDCLKTILTLYLFRWLSLLRLPTFNLHVALTCPIWSLYLVDNSDT